MSFEQIPASPESPDHRSPDLSKENTSFSGTEKLLPATSSETVVQEAQLPEEGALPVEELASAMNDTEIVQYILVSRKNPTEEALTQLAQALRSQ